MTLEIDYPITIELTKIQAHYPIAVQGDDLGRRLIISFTSSGEPLDLSGCTAQMKCSFNNQTIAVNSCEIENNHVIAALTKTMLSNNGTHKLQVSLFDSSGSVVSSPIIYIYVSESINTSAVTESADFSALNDLTSKIQSLLDDPAVGDTEVKDARGKYTLLGDRLSAQDDSLLNIMRFLGSSNCVKKSVNFENEADLSSANFYSSGLTLSTDDGCIVAQGTANKSGTIYAMFDKTIELKSDSSRQVLTVMRIKAVDNPLTVYPLGGIYKGYFNYFCKSNIIQSNITDFIGNNSSHKILPADEWVTIWAVLGSTGTDFQWEGTETAFDGLGVYIYHPTEGYAPKLMIQSLSAYVSDSDIRSAITAVDSRLNDTDNSVTALESEIEAISQSINDLGSELTDISAISENVYDNSDRISSLEGEADNTKRILDSLNSQILTDEKNISALQTGVNNNTKTLTDIGNSVDDIEISISSIKDKLDTLTYNDTVNRADINALKSTTDSAVKDIADIKANLGLNGDEVVGLQVDFENRKFTRLAGAVGKSAGTDFDVYEMFGGRKRCNVADDGTITAYYGDENYADDGSNGQVMVYQPAFYYKVVPVIYEKNKETGIGYHMRKANYYVTSRPHAGFKLHPVFYDENGNEIDYILFSAYEGSLYSNHHIVSDDSETSKEMDLSVDQIYSIANTKPISGLHKNLTRANFEILASNRGAGWHCDTIKSVSANQLLMMIELGTMNTQSAIGQGVVSITDDTSYNCSSFTGYTSALGNSTGQAANTVNRIGSVTANYTESGKVSVTYRGIENPWGNIWKFVNGINIWGNGTMGGGQPYISDNFNFTESTHGDNYIPVGFTLPNEIGYINAMGYSSEEFDWLLMPSEVGGTYALPVGDYSYTLPDLNGYCTVLLGSIWMLGLASGGFCWNGRVATSTHLRNIGGRLIYIPSAKI